MWMLATFVVLGLGGAVVEHYFGSIGVTTTTTTAYKLPPTPTAPSGVQLSSSLRAFMGLKEIGTAKAPGFTLRSQGNKKWGPNDAKGKVVVLTFESKICNDICPVLSAEIKQARSLLGANSSKVMFAIVNSDPNDVAQSPTPPALTVPGLLSTPNVLFLNGPLLQLNAVWISYGVSVKVGVQATQVAHNNIMYFIDPKGQLRAQAVPFGNESNLGVFSLGGADIDRFARGIAQTADSLIK